MALPRYETLQNETPKLDSKPDISFDKNPKDSSNLYLGLIYSLISGTMFSATTLIAKRLKFMDPMELTLYRFSGCALLALTHVAYYCEPLFPEMERVTAMYLLARGLLVTPAIASAFSAIHQLPVAEATVLIFTSPIFTAILAKIFNKEDFSYEHCLSALFTLMGVVFLTKLPLQLGKFEHGNDSAQHMRGCGLAILAALLMSFMYILARKTKGVHEAVSVFHYSWVAVLVSGLTMWYREAFTWGRCGTESALLLLLILTSFYGQFFMTKALRTNQAGPVAIVRAATDISVTYVLQILAFGVVPDICGVLGSVCICVAVVLVTIAQTAGRTQD